MKEGTLDIIMFVVALVATLTCGVIAGTDRGHAQVALKQVECQVVYEQVVCKKVKNEN